MSELLTLEEAGALLKVSRKTVWYWIKEKRLPGIQAGKQWRVRREDLEAFVQAKLPETPLHQPTASKPESIRPGAQPTRARVAKGQSQIRPPKGFNTTVRMIKP
jgi:excisionase family DNA binding protein